MKTGIALSALLAAGIAGGVGLAARLDRAGEPANPSLDHALTLQSAFNRAAAIATKAVVHITIHDSSASNNVGSGVIVSAAGHIVTNHHVIREHEGLSCRIRFVDGAEYDAEIQGWDEDSDLAVLKFDPGNRPLHPIEFADSDKVRVGDIVFAVGSPFGYTHTVTSGIVSAKHRRVALDKPYEDYLQTDAAINPGNSGGALVNLRGELVGLNSAMVSGSRTNDGVGLAIASNLVKWAQQRLIRDGVVRRGYLGIDIVDLDYKVLMQEPLLMRQSPFQGVSSQEELNRRFGVPGGAGALIVKIRPDGPAESIGLRQFDMITEFDGRPVRNIHEMVLRVVELEPGRSVNLKFVRGGEAQTVSVTLQERPSLDELRERGPAKPRGKP